jgi:hypothetical protein
MGTTIVEVIKVVAPVALEALAKAAIKLVSGGSAAQVASFAANSTQDNGSIIKNDTSEYINTEFSQNYRYFYKGAGSTPPGASFPLVGATEDVMVWDPKKNEISDINAYITKVLQDTLSDADAIEVAQNLSGLFEARFTQVDLSWTPFMKRYNLAASGVTIDVQMVTAAGYDENKNPLGVASYCFVAYKTGK